MQRVAVTAQETLGIVGVVLLVDCVILVFWTALDPLQWERHSLSEDKFGNSLSSEGFCVSDHWAIFAGIIALFHFALMGLACWMSYLSRDIPTEFSEGKVLFLAMVSNMQIFVVAVPCLIILGSDSQTAVFIRSVVIWMNDLVVVGLIFGNLIKIVYIENRLNDRSKTMVREAMDTYKERRTRRSTVSGVDGLGRGSGHSSVGSYTSVNSRQRPSYTAFASSTAQSHLAPPSNVQPCSCNASDTSSQNSQRRFAVAPDSTGQPTGMQPNQGSQHGSSLGVLTESEAELEDSDDEKGSFAGHSSGGSLGDIDVVDNVPPRPPSEPSEPKEDGDVSNSNNENYEEGQAAMQKTINEESSPAVMPVENTTADVDESFPGAHVKSSEAGGGPTIQATAVDTA